MIKIYEKSSWIYKKNISFTFQYWCGLDNNDNFYKIYNKLAEGGFKTLQKNANMIKSRVRMKKNPKPKINEELLKSQCNSFVNSFNKIIEYLKHIRKHQHIYVAKLLKCKNIKKRQVFANFELLNEDILENPILMKKIPIKSTTQLIKFINTIYIETVSAISCKYSLNEFKKLYINNVDDENTTNILKNLYKELKKIENLSEVNKYVYYYC